MNDDNIDKKIKQQAKKFNSAINRQFRNRIECYKDIHYNPNTKGSDYEKVVASLLNDYLGARFDFYTRAQVIDAQMQYVKILPSGGNEFDVVATFIPATPKIVIKLGDTTFVPYDAIALIAEVKSTMTKKFLEDDLKKLESIMQLKLSVNRFTSIVLGSKDKVEDRPFRLLVYFDLGIDSIVMENLLDKYWQVWDAVFLVDKEQVIINKSLPIMKTFLDILLQYRNVGSKKFIYWHDVAFTLLLLVISKTIPVPLTVDVNYTLSNIGALAYKP